MAFLGLIGTVSGEQFVQLLNLSKKIITQMTRRWQTPIWGGRKLKSTRMVMDYAHNMAVYPDEYTILDVFLQGIPLSIFTELLTTIGLSPEINSLEEFVVYAKEVEQRTKTEAYYRQLRMPRSETNATKGQDKTGNKVAPVKPRETMANKPQFERYNTPYTNKRPQYRTHDKRKQFLTKNNKAPVKSPEAPVAHKATNDRSCFNCGEKGHFSYECPKPRREKKVALRAIRSTVGNDDTDEADEEYESSHKEDDDQDGPDELPEPQDELYIEFEEPDQQYHEDDNSDFVRMMSTTSQKICKGKEVEATIKDLDTDDDKVEIIMAFTVFPLREDKDTGEAEVKVRKYKLLASGKHRIQPVTRPDEKECLATWVEIGGLQAWTLWDSGSTTTGITPSFAEIAKIAVDILDDPHILQLGTVGSRSIIKFGTDVTMKVANTDCMTYVDVANFDHYDMIIGTPFMRRNKVKLDFEKNEVVINGQSLPAIKVTNKDLDPRLRRHRAMDKKHE